MQYVSETQHFFFFPSQVAKYRLLSENSYFPYLSFLSGKLYLTSLTSRITESHHLNSRGSYWDWRSFPVYLWWWDWNEHGGGWNRNVKSLWWSRREARASRAQPASPLPLSVCRQELWAGPFHLFLPEPCLHWHSLEPHFSQTHLLHKWHRRAQARAVLVLACICLILYFFSTSSSILPPVFPGLTSST